MAVCHYAGFERWLEGGIKTAIRQQRSALDFVGVEFTTDPTIPHDVLHLNVVDPASASRLVRSRRSSVPVIYHVHSTGEDFRNSFRFSTVLAPVFDRYVRLLYGRADHLIAVSPYTKQLLRTKGVDVPISVVGNGIEPDRLDGVDQFGDRDEKYGIDGVGVVNLGHVFERKGVADFVQAAQLIPDIEFRWFGSRMNRWIRSGSVNTWVDTAPENVAFTGYVEDVREAFATGDIFFFPSYDEHRPIALLEAMYCGLPIVVRDIPSFEGWIEHDTHCLKGSSPVEFAGHIQALANDPALRTRLGGAARDLASEYTLEAIGRQLAETYAHVTE